MKKISASRFFALVSLPLVLALTVFSAITIGRLNREITARFDGQRWFLPAIVYARPLELYPGLRLSPAMLERELQLAGYRREMPVQGAGGYSRSGSTIRLVTRDFHFPSGLEKSTDIEVTFAGGQVARLTAAATGQAIPAVRLDPARIGSFHPLIHEDRIVIESTAIPARLRAALIAVEDRNFDTHHGVSPSAIGRALVANIRAGRTVQGGSTLTQQLVKNYFLTRDRTLARKLQEAVMALLLEYHYSKDEILTAYVNEVFLGQDGGRAVHGFGLASRFYFRRDLRDLSAAQIAALVGLVKGPSYYDPRRHPERSLARRNIVLQVMLASGVIDRDGFERAMVEPLTEVVVQQNGFNRFPAFLDLVKRQVRAEYREEDLERNGLVILTTLDPQVQWAGEKQLQDSISALSKGAERGALEGAMIVTGRDTAEVQAVVGGSDSLAVGFNRALDASRPIGSLVKPAVYLAALARGYTLASPLLDAGLSVDTGSKAWQPKNYDGIEHGRVPLYAALAHSYNLATVRLGLEIGLPEVLTTLHDLGHQELLEPYPALLLGAVAMTPLQVTQFYQTIASGGFHMPLRAIQSVMAQDGSLLTRYGLAVEQRFAPELMYLLNHGLQRVMSEGTGSRLNTRGAHLYAGKTGTSDDLRDSWFAGFTADRLAVVWLGRDDNKPAGLTGASGALTVWGKVMEELEAGSVLQEAPPHIGWYRINTRTLAPASALDRDGTLLPFIAGSEPQGGRLLPGLDTERIERETKALFKTLNKLFN